MLQDDAVFEFTWTFVLNLCLCFLNCWTLVLIVSLHDLKSRSRVPCCPCGYFWLDSLFLLPAIPFLSCTIMPSTLATHPVNCTVLLTCVY